MAENENLQLIENESAITEDMASELSNGKGVDEE